MNWKKYGFSLSLFIVGLVILVLIKIIEYIVDLVIWLEKVEIDLEKMTMDQRHKILKALHKHCPFRAIKYTEGKPDEKVELRVNKKW